MAPLIDDTLNNIPAKPDPAVSLSLKVPIIAGTHVEDDAPTRLFTKRGAQSNLREDLPALKWTTTKEKQLATETANQKRRWPHYYIRDFGNKISPGLEDVRHQAGLRTDSKLAEGKKDYALAEISSSQVSTMDVMHNWTQEVRDDEFVATINILREGSSTAIGPEGRVVWIHVEDNLPSLERLESHFRSHIARRVQPFIGETTISLFNRVKATRERKLVSGFLGRFLIPGLTRYSARSSHTGNEDHPCLFLSFPYLFLGRFDKSSDVRHNNTKGQTIYPYEGREHKAIPYNSSTSLFRHRNKLSDIEAQNVPNSSTVVQGKDGKGRCSPATVEPESEKHYHQPRTLLQSRYRLESTKRRDRNQTIFNLTNQQIRDCISRPSRNSAPQSSLSANPSTQPPSNPGHLSIYNMLQSWLTRAAPKRERLYIPQLWGVSLSGDIMLTCGPMSIEDLCGGTLNRKDFQPGDSRLNHSLVRFIVEHSKRDDDVFNYPAESCEWYFGLLNKQRKIESHLGTQSLQGQTPGNAAPVELHYNIFYYSSSSEIPQIVDCNNWLQIQSEHSEPHLNLYLKSSTDPAVGIVVPATRSVRQDCARRSNSYPRSLPVPDATTTTTTSPRLLSTPQRERSDNSSIRSTSPASFSHPAMPEKFTAFFEWPFLEEVSRGDFADCTRTTMDRVGAWLAKVHTAVYKSHGTGMDDSLKPKTGSLASSWSPKPSEAVRHTDLPTLKHKFFSSTETAVIARDPSCVMQREGQRIFSLAKQFLKLFVPEDCVSPNKEREDVSLVIYMYWGLIDKILDGIAAKMFGEIDLQILSQTLCELVELGKQTHRGVWRMDGDKKDPSKITVVNSAVIYMPLANALEHLCDLLFDVLLYLKNKTAISAITSAQGLEEAIRESSDRVRRDFELAQRFLIQGGDEDRYHKSLGPVVTPEGITILLLRRLVRGVYRDGTVNIIEIFEKVIERLATKVERSASRFLLLEINHVAEEIDIVLTNFQDQRGFLETYRDYLDPNAIENPGVKRKTRFEYEQNGIEKLVNEVDERIKDCEELKEHVKRLAHQNLQLVEGAQDDINKKLMLFTLVTIVFLPPSFVTSFFGMNLKGIENTDYGVGHFWMIAVPLTGGLLLLSVTTLYWNSFVSICRQVLLWQGFDSLDDD